VPELTRRFLGTAAAFVLLGVIIGFTMLVRRELGGVWPHPSLVSVHAHLILVGAVTQIIIGTAWWFFPRPGRNDPPASERAAVLAWWFLTVGTLLRAGGEAAFAIVQARVPLVVIGGGALQLMGMISAVIALRRRVRRGLRDT
jgi:heme/copper-type cytochrome/quinol oxidase subunit 1